MPPSPSWHFEDMLVGGRYRVEKMLGSGGMGSVWFGRHTSLGHPVAVKFIHPELTASDEAMRRFETEAKAAARIRSRHAVAVIDHGVTDSNNPFIVMEYLEGETLDKEIRKRGRLPFEEVVEVVVQVARALASAHAAGVVHRDLKPDNILLAKDPGAKFGYSVKVLDFGIAKLVHDDNVGGVATTKTGMVLGTPLYMSPEGLTASAPVSAASDIWSLGACAFAAATGKVPFDGEAIGDVVLKVCSAPMPVPSRLAPDLPKAFDAWFLKACARNLHERFPSAEQLGNALAELERWNQSQREQVAYELRKSSAEIELDEDRPRSSHRSLLLAGILMGAATMLGVLGFYVFKRTKEADETARAAMEKAAAVIEAENERKLREAERHFWSNVPDAGAADAAVPDAGADAGRKPKRSPR
ncbi:MAG TPA: serine/threonine-protein kinase [Polyangiaceae bacterium]|nr:serine/threonine-protein kinase [Polyangiaceae bacterium]